MNIRTLALFSALSLPALYACKNDRMGNDPAQRETEGAVVRGEETATNRGVTTTGPGGTYKGEHVKTDDDKLDRDRAATAKVDRDDDDDDDKANLDGKSDKLAANDKDDAREASGVLGTASLRAANNTSLTGRAEFSKTQGDPKLKIDLTSAKPGTYSVAVMEDCPAAIKDAVKDAEDNKAAKRDTRNETAKIDADDLKVLGAITVGKNGTGKFDGVLTKEMVGDSDLKSLDDDALVILPSNTAKPMAKGDKKADDDDDLVYNASDIIACGDIEVSEDADLRGT